MGCRLLGVLVLPAIICCGSDEKEPASDSSEEAEGPDSGRPEGCSPVACTDLAANCGVVDDGCGGTLDCGTCASPETCGGGGVEHVCGASCTPIRCEDGGQNCGLVPDGCGNFANCGSCNPPESCGGGGLENVCGEGQCMPATCADKNAVCGKIADGCGGVVDCGTCVAPAVCGTDHQCGCVPTSCAAQGKNCGAIPDGCGAMIDCGTCDGAETCGGGGNANVCGEGPCVPTTCTAEGKNCGTIGNGCGAVLDCGTCVAPQACGGGGEANVCAKPPVSWSQVSTGATHTCGVDSEGGLYCWGANGSGQLGTGDYAARTSPTPVNSNEVWAMVSAAAQATFAITDDGRLFQWGSKFDLSATNTSPVEAPPTPDGPQDPWFWVSSKWGHVCGTKAGRAYCWGGNAEGQLGDGTKLDSAVPHKASLYYPPQGVSAGRDHSCLFTSNSPPQCAGNNWYGQLGSGVPDAATLFVAADSLSHLGWLSVEAGGYHTCAVQGMSLEQRTLWCWGDNSHGQVGKPNGGGFQMVQVGGKGVWVALSTGDLHSCAVGNWDELYCWGDNTRGQIGSGGPSTEPEPVRLSGSWLDVAAGWEHTCAIKTDGSLWCWGNNSQGQLGDGTGTGRPVPTQVL